MDNGRGADPGARGGLYTLFAANAVSMVGNQITGLAIPWFVLASGGSAVEVGMVGVFTFLPLALAAVAGGAVVDRLGRVRTSIAADLASAAAVAAIPLLYLTVGLPFWALLALVFAGAALDAPGGTARMSLLPDLSAASGMPPERANAIAQTVARGASMVGPVLSGGLIGVIGAANVLWVDAATFLVSAALIARVAGVARRVDGRGGRDGQGKQTAAAVDDSGVAVKPAPASGYLADVRAGLVFLRGDRVLSRLVAVVAVLNLVEAPVWGIMLPIYAKAAYGESLALGLMFGSLGAGSVVGAVAYGAVGHRLPRWPIFLTGFLGIGLPIFGLAAEPPLWLAMALLALCGLAAGPINPIIMTVAQERVPAELRGRVFGSLQALAMVAIPLGLLAGGVLLEVVGLRVSLITCAAIYVAVSLGMRFSADLRGIERAG